MTEAHCDDYMTAVLAIKTLCEDPLSILTDLQTALTDLSTKDAQIDTDVSSLVLANLTMTELNKFILVQISRNNSKEINDSLLNLINIRSSKDNIDLYLSTHTEAETLAYTEETENIRNFINENYF